MPCLERGLHYFFVAGIEFLGGEMVGWYFVLCDHDYLLFVMQKARGQDCKTDEQCAGYCIGGKTGMIS